MFHVVLISVLGIIIIKVATFKKTTEGFLKKAKTVEAIVSMAAAVSTPL